MTEKGGSVQKILRGSFLQVGFHKKKKRKKNFFSQRKHMQPQGSSLCLSLARLIFIASTQGLADLSSPARRMPGSGRCQKMHESRQRPVATWRGGHGGRPAQLAPTRPTKDRPQRGGGFERASASQRPRATWPRRAAHPPCSCSAGATGHSRAGCARGAAGFAQVTIP